MSDSPTMSYREKSAWIFLVSTVLVAGFFFLHVPWTLRPEPSPALVHGLFYCFGAWIAIQVVARLIVARLAPEDARTPKDERELLIESKAIRVSRPVSIVAPLLAVSMLHLGATGPAVGYGVVFGLVLGELVNHAARIYFHRRT